MRSLCLLLVSLMLLPLAALAESPDDAGAWRLVREARQRGEVATWVRPVEGHTLKAFKGQVEVPHDMLTVFAVLADVDRFPEWVFQCDHARMMPELGPDIAYVHIQGIWPVADRDAVVRTGITQDPGTLAIRLHSVAQHGLYPAQEDTVRIPVLDNRFVMEPLADGWTRVTFDTFVDPGGAIPAWLANLVAVRAPRDTLEGMTVLMNEPKYQLGSPLELPLRFPGLETMRFPNLERSRTSTPRP